MRRNSNRRRYGERDRKYQCWDNFFILYDIENELRLIIYNTHFHSCKSLKSPEEIFKCTISTSTGVPFDISWCVFCVPSSLYSSHLEFFLPFFFAINKFIFFFHLEAEKHLELTCKMCAEWNFLWWILIFQAAIGGHSICHTINIIFISYKDGFSL